MGSLEEADNINEAIVGYDARDEARICRFTKSDGTCYKGKNCKLEHIHLPEGEYYNYFRYNKDCINCEKNSPMFH